MVEGPAKTYVVAMKIRRVELVGVAAAAALIVSLASNTALATYKGANDFDYNKDGHRDLVVTLEVQRLFADKRFEQTCGTAYDTGISPFHAAPKQKHTIPLLFDGARFRVEPKALARFNQAHATIDKQGNTFAP